ncbi:hypothetical protein [Microbacterium sp. SA39]|uniref:hypothetical protein n=1 Tax=Microbacterium sp. SA39 TaxID=1263625 RepID=UPI0005FA0A8F|nr:hypothetical protein [Microbacterium sp. SA39]KJQ55993.1 hypothetical protein RS85_00119 [Microbacterium sp. SA39]
MSATIDNPSSGPDRRTVLKASAWSLPVVAVALGTPLAAASATEFDIVLIPEDNAEPIGATSPDGTQSYTLVVPLMFDAFTQGTTPAPPGSTVVVSFDDRLLSGVSLTIGGTPAPPVSTVTNGNVETSTFSVPVAIPASPAVTVIRPSFDLRNDGVWVPDAAPYSVSVVAPAGTTDPAPGNNTALSTPNYTATP